MRRTPILLLLPLAACAGGREGGFPSLAPRPIERLGFDEPAAAPPAPAVADPALDAEIAAIRARLAAGATRFAGAERFAAIRIAAARGAAAGSDRWLDAQTALGELDVARADAAEPLATLEQSVADRGVAGAPPYPALDAALTEARAAIAAMTARIAALQAGIAR